MNYLTLLCGYLLVNTIAFTLIALFGSSDKSPNSRDDVHDGEERS